MVGPLPTPSILSRQKGLRLFASDVLHEALFADICTGVFISSGSVLTFCTGISRSEISCSGAYSTESGDSSMVVGEASF